MQTIISVQITDQVRVAVEQDRNEYQVRVYGYQPDPRVDRDYSVHGIFRSEPEALRSYVSLCGELNQRAA
jgi:hypothetical protein